MAFWRSVKRRTKEAVPPLLFLGLVGYFTTNALNGDHGLRAMAARREVLKAAQAELAAADAERVGWERKLAGLSGARLDPDALDEQARAQLNLGDPAELVVYYPKDKRLF
jgi:cell division protein FtsB